MRDPAELGMFYRGRVVRRSLPTEEDLDAFESMAGVVLPEDYKAFLRRFNGGCPRFCFLDVGADGFQIETFYFLSLDRTDYYSVARASAWPSDDLGRPVVAVAGDGSGDQLVIDFGAPVPSVGWWRHDALEGEPKVVRVAASFSELLEKLCEPPDDL